MDYIDDLEKHRIKQLVDEGKLIENPKPIIKSNSYDEIKI